MEAMIWYGVWPIVIYIAYKFVGLNLEHFAKMERLEELERHYGKEYDRAKERNG